MAFFWAKTLGGESAVKLLNKFGILEQGKLYMRLALTNALRQILYKMPVVFCLKIDQFYMLKWNTSNCTYLMKKVQKAVVSNPLSVLMIFEKLYFYGKEQLPNLGQFYSDPPWAWSTAKEVKWDGIKLSKTSMRRKLLSCLPKVGSPY